MTRIGSLPVPTSIGSLYFDSFTNALYAGFDEDDPPTVRMWTVSGSSVTLVGDIPPFGGTATEPGNTGVGSNKVRRGSKSQEEGMEFAIARNRLLPTYYAIYCFLTPRVSLASPSAI